MDRSDLLTWQGLRALAQGEVLNLGSQIKIVRAYPSAPIKHWQQRGRARRMPRYTPTAGTVVYTRMAWRAPWRAQIVAQVRAPIVLVTTYCDLTIKAHATAEMCADGSPVRHWFGVQADTTHPRLTAMPVGIHGRMVPLIQAGERCTTRDIALYLNFGLHEFQRRAAIRAQAWQHFAGLPWVTAESNLAPADYVSRLGRSRFVLSPPGYAWDCYRTYEAIAMGAIPIVLRRPPLTDVCAELPVLLVDDWSEVTSARLTREWETRQEKDCRTLTLSYWRERIQKVAHELS